MQPSSPVINFTLSVVSHGQRHLLRHLLTDLERLEPRDFEVILTVNIPEDESAYRSDSFHLRVIRNIQPKGFGANHNAAFECSRGEFFVVVNPDIRLPQLKLSELRKPFDDPRIGACAPLVLNSGGLVEGNARRFQTLTSLFMRLIFREPKLDYSWGAQPISVDWLAGMFVMFRRQAFRELGGFDARRFFMYYEDVDICARLHQRGWEVLLQPSTRVVHDAQHASHRNLRHFRWHLTSVIRYLTGF